MEKVKITRKQADAIERCRVGNCDRDVMAIAISTDSYKNYEEMQYLASGDFELFLSAMSNGYMVEQTPEDKVKEYYYKLNKDAIERDFEKFGVNTVRYEMEGILKTLFLLNIKIEGIN